MRPDDRKPYAAAGADAFASRRLAREKRKRARRRRLTIGAVVLVCALLVAAGVKFFLSRAVAPPGEGDMPAWITQDLLPVNAYSRPGTELAHVRGVVVHYTGNPGTTAEQNRSYFAGLAETHETKASSHFVIGIDGTIIQCVPLDEIAYCSNERNADTVSIECCHADETGAFSEQTYASLVKLTKWLCETFRLKPDDVIRHYDVTGKNCPRYFVEHEDAWAAFLNDLTKQEPEEAS